MKPSIPKGTRDFGPNQVLKREYIFDIIKDSFKLYGFAPLETPAMESLSTLPENTVRKEIACCSRYLTMVIF